MADHIGGYRGDFDRTMQSAQWIVDAGFPLTLNAVVHRQNLPQLPDAIAMAVAMKARRREVAMVKIDGWAMLHGAAMMQTIPTLSLDNVTDSPLANNLVQGCCAQRLLRRRLDAGTMSILKPPQVGFRRLSVSGDGHRGRFRSDRSRVHKISGSRRNAGIGGDILGR